MPRATISESQTKTGFYLSYEKIMIDGQQPKVTLRLLLRYSNICI